MGTGMRLSDDSTLEIGHSTKHVGLKFTKAKTVVEVFLEPEYALALMYAVEEELLALHKTTPDTFRTKVSAAFKGLFK